MIFVKRTSRYAAEFEEVGFVGRGGFGSVVKCRLRRKPPDKDDIYFAVKKIKLPQSNTQDDKFVLREASNLASLHHKNIVRYFSAWLEESEAGSNASHVSNSVYSVHRRLPKLLPVATAPLYFATKSFLQQSDWLSIHQYSGGSSQHEPVQKNDPPSSVKAFLREQLLNQTGEGSPDHRSDSSSSGRPSGSSDASVDGRQSQSFSSGPHDIVFGQSEDSSSEEVVFEDPSPSAKVVVAEPTPVRKTSGEKTSQGVERCLHIAMEYVEGLTLRQAIANASFVKNKRLAWDVFGQICEGLSFMHAHSFVHRDLKPENIFIKTEDGDDGESWTVKIGDFGLSTFLDARASEPAGGAPLSIGVGTRFYIAPEVLEADGQYDQAADLFGLGVILFEMLTAPMKTSMERHVSLSKLIKTEGTAAESLGITDKLAQSLIRQLLVRNPSERVSALRVLQLLPQKSSGDQLLDIVTANPFSHEMLRLLTSLFGRHETEDRAKRFWENYSLPAPFVSRVVTELKAYVHCLFRTFNAVQIDLPVLTPSSSSPVPKMNPFRVLDASGMPLVLPISLLRLMKDTLGCVQLATVVKRFAVEDIFFRGSNKDFWDAPNSALRIVFDAAVNLGKLESLDRAHDAKDRNQRLALFEAEPIRVLWVLAQVFQPWIGETVILFTFTKLLPLLLTVVLKVPYDSAGAVAEVVRTANPSTFRVQFINKMKEIMAAELRSGKLSVKDFEGHLRTIDAWRVPDAPAAITRRIRESIVLEEPSDPHVVRLSNLLSHIDTLQETLAAALGVPQAAELSICLSHDSVFFDGADDDGFMFVSHVRRPTAAAVSVLKFSAGFDLLSDMTPCLGLGGRYDAAQRAGYGVEVDIQMVIDSILISTADPTCVGSELTKWKSRWRNHISKRQRPSLEESSSNSDDDTLIELSSASPKLTNSNKTAPPDLRRNDNRRQFLLLPPSTPIDTIKWLRALRDIVGPNPLLDAEIIKTKTNWRLAFEAALAPPLFRRFNPMMQTGAAHPDKLPSMVYIIYQSSDLVVPAFSLKTKLADLRITANIYGQPISDIGKARKRARQDGVCDWLVFLSMKPKNTSKPVDSSSPSYLRKLIGRGDDARFRLSAVHAGNYLSRSDLLRNNELDLILEECERWFDDIDELRAQLVVFYVELLAAMSPSSGHLFTDTVNLGQG